MSFSSPKFNGFNQIMRRLNIKTLIDRHSGTFLVMLAAVPLFGWAAKRFPVRRFLPYVYYFFIANLKLFFVIFKRFSDV